MQHSKRDNTWSKWGIFLGVAVALGALVVVGWTFMQNRFQPGSSLDADVTIGIDRYAAILGYSVRFLAAAERLLVDNVYETLVTVDQDNKLQPGLATSWKTSDDGLTVTRHCNRASPSRTAIRWTPRTNRRVKPSAIKSTQPASPPPNPTQPEHWAAPSACWNPDTKI